MWLLVVSAIGFVFPNGLFAYWIVRDGASIDQVLADRLALAFIIDLFLALGVMCYLAAMRPIGPVRWGWFLFLSILGGLGFSIPLYVWLNWRAEAPAKPFIAWWREL